jgi:chromosomal replication initiation ATPase DnaA
MRCYVERQRLFYFAEIGKIMQRDHSTICHALNMYELKGEGDDTSEA